MNWRHFQDTSPVPTSPGKLGSAGAHLGSRPGFAADLSLVSIPREVCVTWVPSMALSPPLSPCAPSQLSAMPSSCPPAVGLPCWLNSHLENALRFAPGHCALFPLLCRSFCGFAEGSCQPTPQTQRRSATGSSSWRTPHP